MSLSTPSTLTNLIHHNILPHKFTNYYTLLRIPSSAPFPAIRVAHARLRNPFFATDYAKYRLLEEAYLVLADPERRRKYDDEWAVELGVVYYRDDDGVDGEKEMEVEVEVYDENGFLVAAGEDEGEGDWHGGRADSMSPKRGSARVGTWGGDDARATLTSSSKIPLPSGYINRARHAELLCARPRYMDLEERREILRPSMPITCIE